jgi:hypothetical protein
LLVHTDAAVGLTDEHVEELLGWVSGLSPGPGARAPSIRYFACGGIQAMPMKFILAAAGCAALAIADFLLYESSGASDCEPCSAGQSLLGWGLVVLPLAVLGLLALAAVSMLRRRPKGPHA